MSGVLSSDPVDIAAGHLSAGRVSEAGAIYEQVLRAEPTHARALCGLGAVALRGGEVGRAFELIGRAAAIAPADGTVAGNLGVVHVARKDLPAAEDCFRRALDLAPDQPGLHANLAMVLLARGDHETALTAQRRAVALAPSSAGQRFNLAVILGVVGRTEAAAAAYEETLAIDPAHAGALANLSVLRKRAGRLDEAEGLLDEARLREPLSPEILANHADLLLRRGRHDEGLAEMRRAVGLAPANASLRAALGAMLMEIGLLDEAGREVAAAARRAPDNADLAFVLARLLLRQGRLDDAQEAADRAARPTAAPGCAGAMNAVPGRADALATELLLRRGRYAEAWDRMDARLAGPAPEPSSVLAAGPPRDVDLSGTGIRLVALDAASSLFAARFVPALAARGASPRILCPPVLARLMATVPGVAETSPADTLDLAALAADEVPTLLLDALPRWLRVTPLTPAPRPVFVIPPGEEAVSGGGPPHDSECVNRAPHAGGEPSASGVAPPDHGGGAAGGGTAGGGTVGDGTVGGGTTGDGMADGRAAEGCVTVGLWWEGPGPGENLPRALAGVAGVVPVSLQCGEARDAARALLAEIGAVDRGGAIDDFRDLAAAIGSVDVMIAPDGPVAHLAGGLGVETWVLIGRDGSWYWPNDEAPSPWYPASRAFRQSADGTWTPAFDALRAAAGALGRQARALGGQADRSPPSGAAA